MVGALAFFCADTLVEPCCEGEGVILHRPANGTYPLYFFFLSPLPFFHTHSPVFRRGGGEYGVLAHMLMWDMQGLILWRVWGDPDINAIRAERQG